MTRSPANATPGSSNGRDGALRLMAESIQSQPWVADRAPVLRSRLRSMRKRMLRGTGTALSSRSPLTGARMAKNVGSPEDGDAVPNGTRAGRSSRRTRARVGPWQAGRVLGVAGTLATVVLLTTLSLTGGTPIGPLAKLILKAPYAGSVNQSAGFTKCISGKACFPSSFGKFGCENGSIVKSPAFSLRKGTGGFALSSSATACRAYSTGNTSAARAVDAQAWFEASINVSARGGTPTLYANGTFNESGLLSPSWGSCRTVAGATSSLCDRGLSAYLFGSADLVDVTKGRVVASAYHFLDSVSHAYNVTRCSSSSGCTSSVYPANASTLPIAYAGSFSCVFPQLTGMVKADQYVVRLSVIADVIVQYLVSDSRLSGFSANALMDFHPPGDGVVLLTLVET